MEFLVLQSHFSRIRNESDMMQHKICEDLMINFHGGRVQTETRCLFKLSRREHRGSKMPSDKTIVCQSSKHKRT